MMAGAKNSGDSELGGSTPPSGDGDLSVLLCTPTGRDGYLLSDLLSRDGFDSVSAPSPLELLDRLGPRFRAGMLLIAEESLSPSSLARLADALDGQPEWSDLPLLILGRQERPGRRLEPLLRRRSCIYLRRPVRPPHLIATVSSAVEVRRRQYEVRDLIQEAHALNRQLVRRAGQLRHLSLELTEAEERERRRLAVYVHDELQQLLAGAKFHVDVASRRMGDPERAQDSCAVVKGLLLEAMDASRTLAHELSPAPLRTSGLVAALRWLAGQMAERHGMAVDLDLDPAAEPGDQQLSTFLFRAIQELLLNVSKHSGQLSATVRLRREAGTVAVTVADSGVGFDALYLEGGETPSTFGIFSLRERSELLGGRLQVESSQGSGTTVSITVPAPEGVTAGDGLAAEETARIPRSSAAPADEGGVREVRVILVDDHAVLRGGLRVMLSDLEGAQVIGEYSNGAEAVSAADELEPDLILMDVQMPGMDGVEATRIIKRRHPEVRIIGLSMFDDAHTCERMLAAGAEQYLSKSGPGSVIRKAIFASPAS